MQVNRRYVWAGGALAAILLIFLWRWGAPGRKPNVQRPTPAPAIASEVDRMEPHAHKSIRDEECAACPDFSVPPMSAEKRTVSDDAADGPSMIEMMTEFASQLAGCEGVLTMALINGNPNPNTGLLGDCGGETPLHMPILTADLVQAQIDAGADVNAQDQYGRTPLHVQSVLTPDSESLAVIELLLEAGADPTLENEQGEAPWKTARLRSSVGIGHLASYESVERDAAEMGLTVEAFLDSHPQRRARLEEFMEAHLNSARIKRLLLNAAASESARAKSDGMDPLGQ